MVQKSVNNLVLVWIGLNPNQTTEPKSSPTNKRIYKNKNWKIENLDKLDQCRSSLTPNIVETSIFNIKLVAIFSFLCYDN